MFPFTCTTEFDSLVRSLLCAILNISLDDSACSWTQASLPIRCGGLGIWSATQLALSAYLASAAGSLDLVRQSVPPRLQDAPYPEESTVLNSWSQGHSAPPPTAPTSCQQRAWDSPRVTASAAALLEAVPDPTTRAHLLASRRKESGAWLQAFPMSALGLHIDNNVVRVAVGLRLGVCHSLPGTPLPPVWNGSGPPWVTWPKLQEKSRPPLTACGNCNQ